MAFPDTITLDTADVDGGTARELKTIEWLSGQLGALLGALNATKNADPAATASINANLKGILENTGNGVVLTANMDSGVTASLTNTTAGSFTGLTAPSAGTRQMLSTAVVSNSHATVGTDVELINDGTVMAIIPAAPAYGGGVVMFSPALVGGDGDAWTARCVTTGAAVRVTVTVWNEAV